MVSYHVEFLQPTTLIEERLDSRQAFEQIWSLIPKDRPRRLWGFLPERGVFIKGATATLRLSRRNLRHSRCITTETRAIAGFRRCGLPVPEILGWGVEQQFGLTTRSFLIERLLTDVVDLQSFLEHPLEGGGEKQHPERRAEVFRAVGSTIGRMHGTGCVHRDLSGRNILLQLDGEETQVTLIDCPRARHGLPLKVMKWVRRGDVFRITRSVLRSGASVREAEILLRAAEVAAPRAVIEAALASIEAHADRPVRTRLWMLLGR